MAFNAFHYVLTETAEADVEEALDHVANELSNPDAASALADALEERLEEICKAPKTGRPVSNPYLKRTDVRRFLVKNYIAYYLIDESMAAVVVLRVVYGGRDQDKILKGIST